MYEAGKITLGAEHACPCSQRRSSGRIPQRQATYYISVFKMSFNKVRFDFKQSQPRTTEADPKLAERRNQLKSMKYNQRYMA